MWVLSAWTVEVAVVKCGYIGGKCSKYHTDVCIKSKVYLTSEICYGLQILHLFLSINGSWGLCWTWEQVSEGTKLLPMQSKAING